MSHLHLLKAHGTGNDFVLLIDDDGQHDLSADFVSALCHRRFGIGADGLIRVVRTRFAAEAEIREFADRAEWFMDYRNADGSAAEMCGNGARVFAHYLHLTGRIGGNRFLIMTRAGMRWAEVRDNGNYAIEMGTAEISAAEVEISVNAADAVSNWRATAVRIPNPHAVVEVSDTAEAGGLQQSPSWAPAAAFPSGTNVEFIEALAENHFKMRVFERGVGETYSCGTGACAAAAVMRVKRNLPLPSSIQIEVTGGTLTVEENEESEITLVGPAEIVAEFKLHAEWLSHRGKI